MTVEIYSSHEFTTTPGAGEVITKEFNFNRNLLNNPLLKHDGAIKNLRDFSRYINSQNTQKGSRGHRGSSLVEKLRTLGVNLSEELGVKKIDPIEYFIQLYYGDGLSIQDIFERIKGKGLDYKEESGLRKLFTQTFNWQLKETHTQTEITKKKVGKVINERKENLKIQSKKLEDARRQEFVNWFLLNSKKVEDPTLNLDYFNGLQNKLLKIKYILNSIYGITDEGLNKLRDYPIGTRTIARYIQDLMNDILEKRSLKIIITPAEIERLLKKA